MKTVALPQVKYVLYCTGNPRIINQRGRTCLHLRVISLAEVEPGNRWRLPENRSEAEQDIENMLILYPDARNQSDDLWRTPLHYAVMIIARHYCFYEYADFLKEMQKIDLLTDFNFEISRTPWCYIRYAPSIKLDQPLQLKLYAEIVMSQMHYIKDVN